jgi:hypothetical protein
MPPKRIRLGVCLAGFALPAHACDLPPPPGPSQAEVETYLRAADTYLLCERKLADETKLSPPARKAAYEAYLNGYASMQKAADRYNASLSAAPPAS